VDLAIDQIIDGLTTPAFFNDAVIQRGLRALGMPADEACDYINSTCVEITPVGASNVWVASPYFNLPGLLLEEIKAQAAHAEADTFDAFTSAYQQRLSVQIQREVAQQNEYRMQRERNGRKPLQSAFTRDCLERGRDIDDSGARYNWVECSFVGLANLIDSLIVIKHEVFGTHPFSFAQLAALLDADYEGGEGHRLRFLNRYAKYGNADPEPDTLAHQITTYLRNECQKHRMQPDNSPFVPGTFCWIMHEQLGKVTGATPDGRRATVALSDAAGPAQGRERHGPTAAIRSTTSWDHSMMIGGLAYNMKFTSALFADTNARGHLRNLILTYLRLGGLETQINIVNRATLLLARQNPEAYADLIVRIGGYCDYFTRLSPRMQDELIMRAEYETF
jgi:formate C-acetyltransferase